MLNFRGCIKYFQVHTWWPILVDVFALRAAAELDYILTFGYLDIAVVKLRSVFVLPDKSYRMEIHAYTSLIVVIHQLSMDVDDHSFCFLLTCLCMSSPEKMQPTKKRRPRFALHIDCEKFVGSLGLRKFIGGGVILHENHQSCRHL